MKQLVKYSLMSGLVMMAAACTQPVNHQGRKPLVQVGKQKQAIF